MTREEFIRQRKELINQIDNLMKKKTELRKQYEREQENKLFFNIEK
jgi:hypothetical protein